VRHANSCDEVPAVYTSIALVKLRNSIYMLLARDPFLTSNTFLVALEPSKETSCLHLNSRRMFKLQ
jgi:hypothetical protein